MKGFSIIIVTWNGLHHLKEFLPSVAATDYPDYEIIIADNASMDESAAWVRASYPEIKIASFDENHGYTGGNNRAVPYASKEILIFLNNDVKVSPNWLYGLNGVFEADERTGAAQPKILSYREPDTFEYAGAAGGFIDKYGYPLCRGRIFDQVEKDTGQYDDETEIFWASGAALAIQKDLFEKLNGFDESFRFHMEEIDLCWRLQNEGYKIKYTSESVVYHLGGGSLPMGSPRKVYFNFRNSLTMLVKNYSEYNFIRRFFIRLILDDVAMVKALISGKPKEFLAILRAQIHFLRTFSEARTKRKELLLRRIEDDNPNTMISKSVVKAFFLEGIKNFREFTR